MSQQSLAFMDDEYLGRSWGMLTRSPGWLKPVLVLSLVSLVPIVGWILALGYALEWARLTAWGVDSSPKQAGVSVGGCLSAGWRGLLVELCWAIPYGLVAGAITGIAGGSLSGVVETLLSLVGLFVGVVVMVAMLRATIYQQFGAGMGLGRIFEMVGADVGGLFRITGISILGGIITSLASGIVLTVGSLGTTPALVGMLEGLSEVDAGSLGAILGAMLSAMGPAIALAILAGTVVSTLFNLLVVNAVGLWMLQFNVPAWAHKDAPLPPRIAPAPRVWDAPAHPVVPAEPLMPDQTIRPRQGHDGDGTIPGGGA